MHLKLRTIGKINLHKYFFEKFLKTMFKTVDFFFRNIVLYTSREYVGISCGSLAQLGEHLPYKQRVIGSSPIVSIKLFQNGTVHWPGSSVG